MIISRCVCRIPAFSAIGVVYKRTLMADSHVRHIATKGRAYIGHLVRGVQRQGACPESSRGQSVCRVEIVMSFVLIVVFGGGGAACLGSAGGEKLPLWFPHVQAPVQPCSGDAVSLGLLLYVESGCSAEASPLLACLLSVIALLLVNRDFLLWSYL